MKDRLNIFSMLSSSRIYIVGAFLAVSGWSECVSAQNGFSIRAQQRFVYDDNPLMLSDDRSPETLQGSETRMSVVFKHENDYHDINSRVTVQRNQFSNSHFNATDFSWRLNAKRETRRWASALGASVNYDTPRTAEESSLGESNTPGRRIALSLSPEIAFKLSPRQRIGVNTRLVKRNYTGGSRLTGFESQSVSPFWAWSMTRHDTVNFAFRYQRFASERTPSVTLNSVGPALRWRRKFSPNAAFEFSVGVLGTKYSGIGQLEEWEVNPTYSFRIEHSGQRNRVSFGVNRERQALTNGTEADITTAQIRNEYDISPVWDLNLRSRYRVVEQSENSSGSLDRSYGVSVATQYDISRKMQVGVSYRHAKESYVTNRDDATRNILRANLRYKFQ